MSRIIIEWNDEDVDEDYDPVADILSSLEYEGVGATAYDDHTPDLLAALERVGNVANTARMLVINSDPEEADRYHHDWAICQEAISNATGAPLPTTAARVLKEAADRAAIARATEGAPRMTPDDLPDCPRCGGETERNGPGVACLFCGWSS